MIPPAPVGSGATRPGWATRLALVVALALLVAAVLVQVQGGDDGVKQAKPTKAPGEIFLEPIASRGPDPFTDSAAASDVPAVPTTVSLATTSATGVPTSAGAPSTPVRRVSGGAAGLYGGTLNDAVCDPAKMIDFLESHPAEADAWAGVQGIARSAIRDYISRLTPVILQADTRVTNHGFSNGRAYPIQSVLQAGTAVLVDERGVPRARCRCGNPLLPPAPVSAPEYTGTTWPAFQPQVLVVVVPAPQPLVQIVIVDVETGDRFARPVGTTGRDDRPGRSRRRTTTTTGGSGTTGGAGGTSGPPPGIPAPNKNATGEGVVVVSSIYGPEYPASLAIDGDPTTSWFADVSTTQGTATFRWTGARDDLITRVRITGNGQNPDHPTGSGFATATVRVLDAGGGVSFERTVDMASATDTPVEVWPGVEGRSVELLLEGAQGGDLGGIAELEVGVTR